MKVHKRDKGRLVGEPKCPTCASTIDGFSGISDPNATPKNGDVTICAYCGTGLIVDGERFLAMDRAQLALCLTEPLFKLAYTAVKALRRERQS